MEICHRREFLKLIFYAKYPGLTLEMSAFSLRWPIYIINLVDEKKLSCDTPPPHPHRCSITNACETYPLNSFIVQLIVFYLTLGKVVEVEWKFFFRFKVMYQMITRVRENNRNVIFE